MYSPLSVLCAAGPDVHVTPASGVHLQRPGSLLGRAIVKDDLAFYHIDTVSVLTLPKDA